MSGKLDRDTIVQASKDGATQGMDLFLAVFSHVPEDKLHWSPAPTAKSALRIAAHTALYPSFFAKMVRERAILTGDEVPAHLARMEAAELALVEKATADRSEIERVIRAGTDEFIAALDTLDDEAISIRLDSKMGWTMPMTFLLRLPSIHAHTHTGQLDFLQTCWGDQVVHF